MRARHRVGSSLRELSFGPSYHMIELLHHPEHIEPWEAYGWALALSPPQLHHLCLEVYGAPWESTAVGDFQKLLGFGPWRSMAVKRRIPDGTENHGAPGSNPGPATIKTDILQVKRPRTEAEDASAHHKDTTTSHAGSAGGGVARPFVSAPMRRSCPDLSSIHRSSEKEDSVLKNFFALSSASEPGAESDVFAVFRPCSGPLLDHRPGRQRLFQQAEDFSEGRRIQVAILNS